MPNQQPKGVGPQSDAYKRPSVIGCLGSMVIGILIIIVGYYIANVFFRESISIILAPAVAMGLIVIGGGLYYYWRNRNAPKADPAEMTEKREAFEDWMEEEKGNK